MPGLIRRATLLAVLTVLVRTMTADAVAPMPPDAEPLVHRVYPVADLIVPNRAVTASQSEVKTLEKRLMALLQTSVAPESWQTAGGTGRVDYYPLGMALVVRQTAARHAEIQDLLAALRRLQDVEVTVEVRFVAVTPEMMKQLGLLAGEQLTQPGSVVLDDTQVTLLLRAVQEDRNANVLQAPKLTMFNGQQAVMELAEQQRFVTGVEWVPVGTRSVPQPRVRPVGTGIRLAVLPTVAPDNRTVNLQLAVNLTRDNHAEGEENAVVRQRDLVVEKALKLTDGATAAVTGWTRHRELRRDLSSPVLSKIPYLSKLFTTVSYGKETEQVLLLVTTRVLVRQEEEQAPSSAPVETADPPADAPPSPVEPRFEKPTANPPPPPAEDDTPQGRGPATTHVKSRAFELTYRIDNVGSSGVQALTLWWHRDDGPWQRYPDEIRPTGKLPVVVREPGRYGFHLVPRSRAGLSPAERSADDPALIRVVVDTAAPRLTLAPAQPEGGHVTFAWTCEDDHLGEAPVALSWGLEPHGPWHEIAADLPPAGHYSAATGDLPTRFYLRAEATDRAGNRSEATTAQPVYLDQRTPVIGAISVR